MRVWCQNVRGLASSSDKRHRCFATVKILHLDVAIWSETKCKIEAISPMWEVASSDSRGSGGVAIVVPRQGKMKEMRMIDRTDHFVIVETRVDGVAVIVVGVYMPCNNAEMRRAVEELNGKLTIGWTSGRQVIIGGDVNKAPKERSWQRMMKRLNLVDIGKKEGLPTFIPPKGLPSRLDQIWCSKGAGENVKCSRIVWTGSDHFGIRANVKFGNGVAKIWRLSSAVMENTTFIERCKEEWSKFRDEFDETTELDEMEDESERDWYPRRETNEERTWKEKKRAH